MPKFEPLFKLNLIPTKAVLKIRFDDKFTIAIYCKLIEQKSFCLGMYCIVFS